MEHSIAVKRLRLPCWTINPAVYPVGTDRCDTRSTGRRHVREAFPHRGRLDEEASMSSPEMSSPDMPMRDLPTRGPARPGPYIITGILLTIAVIVPLFVPAYSVAEP